MRPSPRSVAAFVGTVALCSAFAARLPVSAAETSDGSIATAPAQQGRPPAFGFTAFPPDLSAEAHEEAHQLARRNGGIYALHLDDGIPWAEALSGAEFPAKMRNSWADFERRRPTDQLIYLGLAPLGKDRKTLAPASEGSSLPRKIKGAKFSDPNVIKAYTAYARRAVEKLRPDYLNLGIEAGELAHRAPRQWDDFVTLFTETRRALKKDYPDLPIGISFSLQILMETGIAERARGLIQESDYLCLSFYPYMSEFHEKYGAQKLPPPPDQWRKPLTWVRSYTDKAIAICETGYSTRDVELPAHSLAMKGSQTLQKQYIEDLGRIAARDRYLFVVWFLATDYDKLYAKMPEGDGSNRIWKNTGFLDGNGKAKPAWSSWLAIASGKAAAPPAAAKPSNAPNQAAAPAPAELGAKTVIDVGFQRTAQLFTAPPYDQVSLDEGRTSGAKSMRWAFSYEQGRWQWCVRELAAGELLGKRKVAFWTRSDRDAKLFVQLEEKNGETFFATFDSGPSWTKVELDLASELYIDKAKKKDGRLVSGDVAKIILADAGGTGGQSGRRSVWFADWSFE